MNYQPASQPASRTSTLAVVSMIFGILSWCVLPFVGAIVAIICGHLARGEIRRAPLGNTLDGDGMAIAGLVLGYVQMVLGILILLLIFGVLFLSIGTYWR
jgi:thiol:disulfide interchange protein